MEGYALRVKDEAGKVTAAGYSWQERDKGQMRLIEWSLLLWFFGVLGLALVNMRSFWGLALFILSIASTTAAGFYVQRKWWGRRRSVLFHSDGSVSTPEGLPRRWRKRVIEGNHADIASIEVTPAFITHQMSGHHGVAIISTGGDTVPVAMGLPHAHARLVATRLTLALQEIRQGARQEYAAPMASNVIE